MRKAIVLGSAVALVALGAVFIGARTEPISHEGSPAFQALLSDAIARLENVVEDITAGSVGEAHAGRLEYTVDGTCDGSATCDGSPGCEYETVYGQYTCDRDVPDCWGTLTYDPTVPTCDAGLATCDDGVTCMRFYTCDSQFTCSSGATCDGSVTCWNSTCGDAQQTCDGSMTCTGPPDCDVYTFQGNYTCDVSPTCDDTCAGRPDCGPIAAERTTWGQVKKEFSE